MSLESRTSGESRQRGGSPPGRVKHGGNQVSHGRPPQFLRCTGVCHVQRLAGLIEVTVVSPCSGPVNIGAGAAFGRRQATGHHGVEIAQRLRRVAKRGVHTDAVHRDRRLTELGVADAVGGARQPPRGVFCGCYVGYGSRIGSNVKVGNHSDIFGALIEDDVMVSPQVVLTEDRTPRATRLDGGRQGADDWTSNPVVVRRGASIGAGARVAPGVEIGQYALVGIGAVVLRDVSRHALVLGNPARACGWVCRCATTLDSQLRCPQCARTYELRGDLLVETESGG